MSGETEEMSNDGMSVSTNLLWTDNPELEYFRSMMNERKDERVASGLDMNDSLIGDSTLHDMMDGELQMMESVDSCSQESFSPSHRKSPQRHNRLDTSGLSIMEDDTIENINAEDGSILAWFSRQRKERARKKEEEDGTLESDPAVFDVRQLTVNPATGVQQQPLQMQQQQQQQQPKSQRRFFSPKRPPPSVPAQPQYAHDDNIEMVDTSVEDPSNVCIPGFIFVTSGQSSSVQTHASSSQPTKKVGVAKDDDDHRKQRVSTKALILCLALAVVISGIMLTVIFTNKTSRAKGSAAAQAPWTTPAIPTLSPQAPVTVDIESPPSPSGAPSLPFATAFVPTSGPSNAAIDNAPSSSTMLPTTLTDTPTILPTSNVAARLEILSPISVESWTNPNSPQSMALSWLVNDADASTYTNDKLMQRYVLATFYFSTNGNDWSPSSISWIVEWSDECTWWGIECNTMGEVRILHLANENLSGSLPREMQLLSNSLEEIFLNGNNIGGTIPPSLGKLSNLRRLQLTGNALTGSLPESLDSLSSLRNLSVRNNKLIGQLPPELGTLTLLRNLDLSRNSIIGSIPQSYGNLVALESLYLFENKLTGTIPTTFNELSQLTILRVEFNDLVGTMPQGLCNMEQLSADCIDQIDCGNGCCTICCADGGSCVAMTSPPTSEPTFAPTEEVLAPIVTPTTPTTPSISPTETPTVETTATETVMVTEDVTFASTTEAISSCRATIGTDRNCYEDGENIIVSFENCESTEFDWIGIYSTSTNIMELGEPLAWVWACGDQFCKQIVNTGQAIFYNARGTGSFVVYLLRSTDDLDGSFIAYGVGNSFEMSTNCASF
ncbi:RHS repeat-associated core domain containing protein [Nitzschia inconspicua]|uniref:RHS repeat-associated core domain containing protein n=1 Tax=Nitzschia inconspicua TaxID=303405 RepID=A0A9K3LQZ2_9STRA|nr:RHS repeat-associated core domain containing protein [Nitzschia inconspicua]